MVEAVRDVPFIANDTQLDHNRRMLLITGPNMGGKSTYMRQNALIALLATSARLCPRRRSHCPASIASLRGSVLPTISQAAVPRLWSK
ncbi:MAG: hypothetical protein CM15mP103_07420 [Gammaproteobacteria bacterium]|nr:MAG: hypothetical protein CM15mP103_07420 [Gammaproteobacteria bacterium]